MGSTETPSALDSLPVAIRDLFKRGDRDGHQMTPEQRESAAARLTRAGIQGGANLEWMAKLIRHRLGVGNYPTPPSALASDAWGYKLAEDRAEEIAREIKAAG